MGVNKLILTHFSGRYKGDDSEDSINIMNEIKNSAIKEFKKIEKEKEKLELFMV